ncbi:hypothetical protein BMR85_013925, partial [Achromobacter sp. KAs 3-5]
MLTKEERGACCAACRLRFLAGGLVLRGRLGRLGAGLRGGFCPDHQRQLTSGWIMFDKFKALSEGAAVKARALTSRTAGALESSKAQLGDAAANARAKGLA